MGDLAPILASSDDFFMAYNNWRRRKEHERMQSDAMVHGPYGVQALPAADHAREVIASLRCKTSGEGVQRLLPGGKTKIKPDSSYDSEQLAKGVKVESEHTSLKPIQKEIAKVHLNEFPGYYPALKKMEDSLTPKEGSLKLGGAVIAYMNHRRTRKSKEKQQQLIRQSLHQGGASDIPKMALYGIPS
jgi:hypothetical protein